MVHESTGGEEPLMILSLLLVTNESIRPLSKVRISSLSAILILSLSLYLVRVSRTVRVSGESIKNGYRRSLANR